MRRLLFVAMDCHGGMLLLAQTPVVRPPQRGLGSLSSHSSGGRVEIQDLIHFGRHWQLRRGHLGSKNTPSCRKLLRSILII